MCEKFNLGEINIAKTSLVNIFNNLENKKTFIVLFIKLLTDKSPYSLRNIVFNDNDLAFNIEFIPNNWDSDRPMSASDINMCNKIFSKTIHEIMSEIIGVTFKKNYISLEDYQRMINFTGVLYNITFLYIPKEYNALGTVQTCCVKFL